MSGRIKFKGRVQPAIFFVYRSISVPGAHKRANASELYTVQNEAMHEFELVASTPTPFTLRRASTKKKRLYSESLNTFLTEPVSSAALNAIFDASDAGTLKLFLTAKVWYMKFFEEMLKYLTRTAGDTFNLARPQDPAPVEASFKYEKDEKRAKVTHIEVNREIRDIPCELGGWEIEPSKTKGKPPLVKLAVYMRLKEDLKPEDHNNAVRIFISADYTKVFRFAATKRPDPWFKDEKKEPAGTERNLKVWEMNLLKYFLNHTSLERGEKIRQEVIALGAAAAAKPVLETVKVVRDAIDERIITANHWGDLREDWKTERYQRKLSDVFGAIQQSRWWASPVRFIRTLATLLKLSQEERVAMIVQFGTGHCGEHAATSFSVMKALMDAGNAAKFETVAWSGNTNIDHAFVVGGMRVRDVIRVTRTIKVGDEEPGVSITVFNLRNMLSQNPGKSGFVLDPYLAPSVQGKTCTELLESLNAKRRKKKKTDFLRIEDQYPVKPDPTIIHKKTMEGI